MSALHSETRQKLIAVASRLFAAESVSGVSIRRVTREAGVGASAVHYHFSDKDSLLDEVIAREGGRVLAEIVQRAHRAQALDERPDPQRIVETIAVPYFELLDRSPVEGREWLSIIAQLTQVSDERVRRYSEAATAAIRSLLASAYPDTPSQLRARAWSMTVNSLLAALGRIATERPSGSPSIEERLMLTTFLASGLERVMGNVRPFALDVETAQ